MMSDNIVNLNKFRKAKLRDQKKAEADQNAVRFGRTKGQKAKEDTEKNLVEKLLDGHKKDE